MSRPWIATVGGVTFFLVYLVAAATLGSALPGRNWALQLLFYAVAGVAWFPIIRRIMLWSVHKR